MGALYITAKAMIPARQIIIEMVWKQPPSPVQIYKLTAEGVINNTIIQHKRKSMDLCFHWLRSLIFHRWWIIKSYLCPCISILLHFMSLSSKYVTLEVALFY